MAEMAVKPGDVVALVAPDGSRRHYMVSTLTDVDGVKYRLSDHADSVYYEDHNRERTVLTLVWTGVTHE